MEVKDIKLKVIDMDSGQSRTCTLSEARDWDWGNKEIVRIADSFSINYWEQLYEIARYKAFKGCADVDIYEGRDLEKYKGHLYQSCCGCGGSH